MSRRSFFLPARGRRATEASPQQLVATGALGGGWETGDGDGRGWRVIGGGGRPVPPWTHERARQQSVAAYRMNPMAKAIVDTYTSFCLGDTGVSPMVSNPRVADIVRQFWADPRNLVA